MVQPIVLKRRKKRRPIPPAAPAPAPAPGAPRDQVIDGLDELLDTPLARAWTEEGMSSRIRMPRGYAGKGVIAALPRRKVIGDGTVWTIAPPTDVQEYFEASGAATIGRLFIWMWGLTRFLWAVFVDVLRRRNSEANRAIHLRETLEGLGPTFVKLGQQLAVRADFIPYAYCAELMKMLDSVPPFDSDLAIEVIERATGERIEKTFAVFDPNPIGSASLACVYQAMLHDGQKVAVKVRRPGIGKMLAADLQALDWFFRFAEAMTLTKPGETTDFNVELRTMLLEELDFDREARNATLFRDRAIDSKQDWLYAPKVFRQLSNHEVLVTEFLTGVFLSELIGAVDRDDQESLAQIAGRGIDPVGISKRIVELFNWELMESLLFHGDPHPGNIICQPGNKLALIDFGSCGHFSSKTRRTWQTLYHHLIQEDVQGMAENAIALLEPLPPIDLDSFTKELEALYWDSLCASKDDDAEWWERASGVLWMKTATIGRRYRVPINLETLRLFRASFLLDTAVFRLNRGLEMDKEYRRYDKSAGKRARRRVLRMAKKRRKKGPTGTDFLRFEEIVRQSNQIRARVQRRLDNPEHSRANMISKAAYGAVIALRLILGVVVAHAAVAGWFLLRGHRSGQPISFDQALLRVVSLPYYQFALLFVLLVLVRKLLMRIERPDKDKAGR